MLAKRHGRRMARSLIPAKEIAMKKMLTLTLSAALGLSSIALIGCEKSDTEKAQDAQKDTMKDASKDMKDASKEMKDAAKDVGKTGKDAAAEAADAANKAGAAAQNGVNAVTPTTKPATPAP